MRVLAIEPGKPAVLLLALTLGYAAAEFGVRTLALAIGIPLVGMLLARPAWSVWLLIAAIPVTVDFGSGLTVTRLVMPLAVLSVLIGALTRHCPWPNPVATPAARAASVLLLAMLASAILSLVGGAPQFDRELWNKELAGYATRFALFFIVLALVRDEDDLRHAIRALVLSGAVEALVVIAQVHFRLVLPGDWRFSAIAGVADNDGVFRAEGTTPHPVFLAGYLQMVIPFALLMAMLERGWLRLVALLAFALTLYAWTHAYSRSSLLGIFAMVAVAGCIWSRTGRALVTLTMLAILGGLAAHGWNATDFAHTLEGLRHVGQEVRADQLAPVASSLQFRGESSVGGLLLFLEHPLFGVGPGQARHHYLELLPAWATSPFHPNAIHNAFLEIAAEIGIAGFAALLALWAYALRGVADAWHDPGLGLTARFFLVVLAGQAVFLVLTPMVRDMWLTLPLAIIIGAIARARRVPVPAEAAP